MLSNEEREEIRSAVYTEMVDIEQQISHNAGSYDHLCLVNGSPVFSHSPVGPVLRRISRMSL